jgi:ankyrin repeat protein
MGITDGWTALINASFSGYASIVALLLEAKADINIQAGVCMLLD